MKILFSQNQRVRIENLFPENVKVESSENLVAENKVNSESSSELASEANAVQQSTTNLQMKGNPKRKREKKQKIIESRVFTNSNRLPENNQYSYQVPQ